MKSYLRFLSRNKLYTAIETAGLSISLAFVLLLANVVIKDLSCDRMIRDKENIFLVRTDASSYYRPDPEVVFPKIADATEWCSAVVHDAYDGKTQYIHTPDESFRQDIKPLIVKKNFFEFFGYDLVSGEASEVLELRNAVVVSESLARNIWKGKDPVGQTLILTEARMGDVQLTVTGVYKDYVKSILADNGMVVRSDFLIDIERHAGNIPENMIDGVIPASFHFIRLREGADTKAIEEFLLENDETDPMSEYGLYNGFELLSFKDMHYDDRLSSSDTFRNIVDKGIYRTFIFACIILLAFAALNYVSLTMAFSRFRVKEMATRQLLGTNRTGVISRCIAEAGLLVSTSWMFAAALAFALKNQVSLLIGTPINLYTTAEEWVLTLSMMILLSLASGLIPATAILKYKPMEVVKGESRRRDKIVIGKVFIALEGGLSIASVAIALAIYAQTSHMVNIPMGYNTEDLIYIDFGSYNDQKFKDELLAQSYVDTVGFIHSSPSREYAMMSMMILGGETVTIKKNCGDETAFRLLGLEILEDYGTSVSNYKGEIRKTMLCENTIKNLQPHIKDNRIQTGMGNGSQIDGMITNFRQGSVREPDTSAGYGFEILYDENSYDNYLVKVKSDVEGCVKSIRELYASLKPEDQQPSINSLTSLVEANYQEERKILAMVGVFAILSILMTMMAIIALSSYHAQMQTKDIAIMKSFGYSRRKIFSDMALGFIWPVLAGALVTVPAAWLYIQHWLEGYPERIANSAWIYTAAVILVLVIVTVAISSQAAKLMNTDPASELKKE